MRLSNNFAALEKPVEGNSIIVQHVMIGSQPLVSLVMPLASITRFNEYNASIYCLSEHVIALLYINISALEKLSLTSNYFEPAFGSPFALYRGYVIMLHMQVQTSQLKDNYSSYGVCWPCLF